MKQGEIQEYKGIGTIQMIVEDGEKSYVYSHYFFGDRNTEDTIKGAKEMLEWEHGKAREIQSAISVLSSRGYKVYKEIA